MLNSRQMNPHRRAVVVFEWLESRTLMSVNLHINFQPANVTVPAGYIADSGLTYGVRTGGFTYGWNQDNSSTARVRNAAISPDKRYDTLEHMQKAENPNAKWEIAVPNGFYTVHIAAGDPTAIDSKYAIAAEGRTLVTGTPSSTKHWFEGTATIRVTDGRLTITNASGAVNNKIDFLDVTDAPLKAQLQAILTIAGTKAKQTISDIGTSSNYPQYTNADGTWSFVPATHWTSGFFPAELWNLYAATGDTYYRDQAAKLTRPLSVNDTQTGDLAFRLYNTIIPLLNTNPPDYKSLRQVLLTAAASKATQFNAAVGAFKAWRNSTSGNPLADFNVLMDYSMDLPLMFWAAQQPDGNPAYYNEAVSNMIAVQNYMVRADGSSSQFGYFNSKTGAFIDQETYQGYSNTSTWSRGQAWGIYAFTSTAKITGRADFLATAQKMADYFINHLPTDHVPYWDFNAPTIPNAPRDTSAAAIAASGLLNLSKLLATSNATAAAKYKSAASAILSSLASSAYLAPDGNRSILLHGALNVPNTPQHDNGLIYGDYYFTEAINTFVAM